MEFTKDDVIVGEQNKIDYLPIFFYPGLITPEENSAFLTIETNFIRRRNCNIRINKSL